MGWLDYHLHEFEIKGTHKKKSDFIGIPDDDFPDDRKILPSWERPIKYHVDLPRRTALYRYDFGDGWEHNVLLEAISLKEKGQKYPICLYGERACPPEDCGGVSGYYELLEIVKDPKHPEYDSMREWLEGHAQSYWPDNPDDFDPQSVAFDTRKSGSNWRSRGRCNERRCQIQTALWESLSILASSALPVTHILRSALWNQRNRQL